MSIKRYQIKIIPAHMAPNAKAIKNHCHNHAYTMYIIQLLISKNN